jgi:hypothetical protein
MYFVLLISQVQLLLPNALLSNCGTGGKRPTKTPHRLSGFHGLFGGAGQLIFCGNRPTPPRILDGLSCKRPEGFYIVQAALLTFRQPSLFCTASFSAATASIHTPSFPLRGGGKIRRYK